MRPLPVAVLASGGGTNLQALLDHERDGPSYRVTLVLSDREGAGALDRASAAGRSGQVVPFKGRATDDVEAEMLAALESAGVEAVFLAGFLRLIPAGVVARFRRRILNIHPALLPAFGGKGMYGHHVHEAVVAAGVKVTGATVHYVDEAYDTGTIVAQWPVPVRTGDTPDTVAARVLRVEHVLYPAVAEHLALHWCRDESPPPFRPAGECFHTVSTGPHDLETSLSEAFPEA
jgi:formyltetrahydrofolate-dependent phosphoribosylglycinamide formyltransferase